MPKIPKVFEEYFSIVEDPYHPNTSNSYRVECHLKHGIYTADKKQFTHNGGIKLLRNHLRVSFS